VGQTGHLGSLAMSNLPGQVGTSDSSSRPRHGSTGTANCGWRSADSRIGRTQGLGRAGEDHFILTNEHLRPGGAQLAALEYLRRGIGECCPMTRPGVQQL
jgi:hypothetical protein